jgi:hypothetical protein
MGAAFAVTIASLGAVALDATSAWATPGAADPSFNGSGLVANAAGTGATGIVVLPNGNLAVSGDASSLNGPAFRLTLFAPNGSGIGTKPSFSGQANAIALTPSGNIVAAGYESNSSCLASQDPVLAEYNASGSLLGTPTLLPCSTSIGGSFSGVAVDPSTGNILAAGTLNAGTGNETVVVRFTPSGSIDNGFSAGQYVSHVDGNPSTGAAVAFSSTTGETLVTGSETDPTTGSHLYVLALGSSGVLAGGFASSGVYTSSAGTAGNGITVVPPGIALSAGTVFVAGDQGTSTYLGSLGSNGGLIWTGQSLSGVQYSSVAYQPNGNTVSAAGTAGLGQSQRMLLAQYNPFNGVLNSSFGTGGSVQSSFSGPATAAGVAVQTDGKVVAAGSAPGSTAGTRDIGLFRVLGPSVSLTAPGVLQTTSTGGVQINVILTLDESLFGPVPVVVCGPVGSNIANQGQCAVINVAGGTTQVSVPVTVNVTYSAGNQQSFTTSAVPGGGVTPSTTKPSATTVVQHIPTPTTVTGYWMVASDGGIFAFKARFFGSTGGVRLAQPIVTMAPTPDGKGYWLVARDGGVFSFGDAHFFGSTGNVRLNQPIVGMAPTADGRGYWLVAADGGIFAFGDARFHGSTGAVRLNRPIVAMAATPDGKGYWLVASDGGIFAFGDARFQGSTGGIRLNQPIVGMAAYPGAPGYWMVASDGGIFSFGAARFHGSTGGVHLTRPIVGMAATADGLGYWLVASDGGIFAFGDAHFFGSTGGVRLNQPIVGMAH